MTDVPRHHRLGLIVPSSNVTMETELPALLRRRAGPETFTLHSSRARLKNVSPEELRAMNGEMGRCAMELADARCDAVATACLVALMAQGSGFHREAERSITDALHAEGAPAPVVSSAGALIAALEALGARRIALITPYMTPLTRVVCDYIEAEGIEVHDALSLEVPDNVAVGALDQSALEGHWRRLDTAGCDALVLSACVQMPSLAAVAPVEHACGLPVLSAATATAFSLLHALDLETNIPDAGHLLSGRLS